MYSRAMSDMTTDSPALNAGPLSRHTNGFDDNRSKTECASRNRPFQLKNTERHDKVLRTFRCFVADMCQHAGGHAGGAMGMAAIGIALYKYSMRYSPSNPKYFNRDRLLLSNGHTAIWQYIFMHLSGYPVMTWEQLRSYRSAQLNSICPGLPEIETDGFELTTGALGQGIANAVGLAVATKHIGATYNRPGHDIINNMTWCITGDGCLQEGVALEAIQLAGHWKLNNLALIYDNNAVTCDGTVDVTCSEDINAKMKACGFTVIDVFDGITNVKDIVHALEYARTNEEGPTFINIRTVIAFGSSMQGQARTHHGPFGEDDVAGIKRRFDMKSEEVFRIDDDVYEFFSEAMARGSGYETAFESSLQGYRKSYPDLANELALRMRGEMVDDWQKFIPQKDELPKASIAARESAALILEKLAKNLNTFMLITANLKLDVDFHWQGSTTFQHPDLKTDCGITGDYTGRYLHGGVREHAIASISNGLAAFHPGTIIPVTSCLFMFYIYSAAGVRMGALQGLRTMHVATHDSIAIGEDGPTHQAIALPALYRAMPNMLYIRPCDSEETCGAFVIALQAKTTPSLLSLSRNALTQYPQHSSREGTLKGAYVFIEEPDADVTLIGVGSEMVFAVDARAKLAEVGVRARVVSFPCQRLFGLQSPTYRESVMQYKKGKPVVIIEAYAVNGWERYADAGYSMRTFGKSLPANGPVHDFFGFEAGKIAGKVKALVDEVKIEGIGSLRGDFRDLNGGVMGYGEGAP